MLILRRAYSVTLGVVLGRGASCLSFDEFGKSTSILAIYKWRWALKDTVFLLDKGSTKAYVAFSHTTIFRVSFTTLLLYNLTSFVSWICA